MSEWEKFCASRGFSNDGEGYDRFLDSLDGKSSRQAKWLPPPCDITQEQASIYLKRGHDGLPTACDVDLEVWTGTGTELFHGSIDGTKPGEDSGLLICFRVNGDKLHAPLEMLVEDLRNNRLPILIGQQLAVWDERFQCVDSWEGSLRERLTVRTNDGRVLQEQDQALIGLQNYAKVTDHGSRPILVSAQELERALEGRLVEILDASTLSSQALNESHLVCLDSYGIPTSISLNGAHDVLAELLTRNGTYKLTGGVARPVNGPARLISGAITMAKTRASLPCYYRLNEHATVYKPAFWKIDEADVASHSLSEIYVTDGPHPLELGGTSSSDRYVTTMEYVERYRQATNWMQMPDEDLFS